MIANFFVVLASAVLLPVVLAQNQVPIYVPFEWRSVPLTASVIASAAGTTTYALIDGPETGIVTPGPATLIQGPSGASMFYVNKATPTSTLSGVCNLISPVAVCTLNVYETGAALPGGGAATVSSSTRRGSSGTTTGTGSTATVGVTSGSVGGSSSTGTVISMTTIALGFCVGLALIK